jgi:acid phosphatase family membrane protein YuiD
MPSSHAAAVSALSTAVGLRQGFGSVLFGVTLYFSLVIMYDAAGLRRAAGRQAVILNRLIDENFVHPEADTQRLIELLGHTPFEVAVGAILGVTSALLWSWIF